jgi:hypothetical protein
MIHDVVTEVWTHLPHHVPSIFVVRVDLHHVLVVPVSDSDALEELVQRGTARRIRAEVID